MPMEKNYFKRVKKSQKDDDEKKVSPHQPFDDEVCLTTGSLSDVDQKYLSGKIAKCRNNFLCRIVSVSGSEETSSASPLSR